MGREPIETLYLLKRILSAGVRVFYYRGDRERTLNDPLEKLPANVMSFVDELQRRQVSANVRDKLLDLARRGYVTGGRTFGYDNRVIHDQGKRSHVVYVINPAERDVLRRIFEWSAAGLGERSIAIRLNDEHAPAPTPRRVGRPRGWAPSTIHAVLHRELYRGMVRWNRTQKRDAWGRKRQSDRPSSEWIETHVPEYRIVSDELWERVQERLRGVREGYRRATGGVMHGRPLNGVESKYLLTGFATCAQCGGSLHVRSRRSGSERAHVYGCSVSFYRGLAVGDNRTLIRRDDTEDAVIASLERKVLNLEVLRKGLRYAQQELTTAPELDRRAVTDELRDVEKQIERLTSAVRLGGDLPALVESLRDLERQRMQLCARLRAPLVASQDSQRLESELRCRVADWRTLLRQSVFDARDVLHTLLTSKIVFTPDGDSLIRNCVRELAKT